VKDGLYIKIQRKRVVCFLFVKKEDEVSWRLLSRGEERILDCSFEGGEL
jgi:hypothetical protein